MMQEQEQRRLIVFFSYAHADQVWHEQLAKHLSQLKRDGLIEGWSHRQLLPGVDRAKEIDQALRSAHIILLLISADFLASDAQYQRFCLTLREKLMHIGASVDGVNQSLLSHTFVA